MPAPYFYPRFTSEGFEFHEPTVCKRMGKDNWRILLSTLTVKQRPTPGSPPAALRNLRYDTSFLRDPLTSGITFPHRAAAVMMRMDTQCQWFTPGERRYIGDHFGYFGGEMLLYRPLPADKCQPTINLYPEQEDYVSFLVERVLTPQRMASHESQAYLHVETGGGKTIIAMALIARLQGPACVIVPTEELRKTGIETAQFMLPGLRAIAYKNETDKKRAKKGLPPLSTADADIMFLIVNTARNKPPEFYRQFKTIIYDEAHEYQSKSSRALFWLTGCIPFQIGMSATPADRYDMLDRIVMKHLGDPLFLDDVVAQRRKERGEDEDSGDKFVFPGRVLEVHYSGKEEYVMSDPEHTTVTQKIGRIVADPHRFELVAAYIEMVLNLHKTLPNPQEWGLGLDERGVERRHSVLVFAEHREYLVVLKEYLSRRISPADICIEEDPDEALAHLKEKGTYKGKVESVKDMMEKGGQHHLDSVVLRGGATELDRIGSRLSRVVLTTYAYSRRGVDLVHMTAEVLASPRRNGGMQITGRITRKSTDESLKSIHRLVVDLRDVETSLNSQADGRRKVYKDAKRQWPIWFVKNKYSDFPLPPDPDQSPVPGQPPYVPGQATHPMYAEKAKIRDTAAQEKAPPSISQLFQGPTGKKHARAGKPPQQ